jgi:hypothetical protein
MSRNPLAPPRKAVGARWQTTMHSALNEVAEALEEEPQDLAALAKEMKDRKKSNTTTSISFGTHKIHYESDAMMEQKKILNGVPAAERAAQLERNTAMKKALTKTSFTLGDEKPEYESIVHQEMRKTAKELEGYTKVSMNSDLKAAIKKSSLHFGNEKPYYRTIQTDAMQFHGNNNNFKQLNDEVKELKVQLRKHNFTFGDETVKYQTDYAAGYGTMDVKHYANIGKERAVIREQIEEIRKCHFTLGQEKVEYKSDAQRSSESILGHEPQDLKALLDHNTEMKKKLQKTQIQIGNDEEYY